MHNPPNQKTWTNSHHFVDEYREAYEEGYIAAQSGLWEEFPYRLYGRERDSLFEQEMNVQWHQGYWDFY